MILGELCAVLTAFCWSGSSFAFTAAAERLGSLQLNINRLILAAILLFITILVLGINFHLSSWQYINLAISGSIGFVFGDTFLFKAYQHVGARIGMLLMSLSPVMSAVLAFYFLNELISFWGIIGMMVTIGGIIMVVAERSEKPSVKYRISKIGIFYGLMGALGQAVGLIFAKEAFNIGEINGFVATIVRIVSAVVLLLPMIILSGKCCPPRGIAHIPPWHITSRMEASCPACPISLSKSLSFIIGKTSPSILLASMTIRGIAPHGNFSMRT